jgi:hypothetical protein|tara:strand:+ start:232 stop:453 length:222 start_codon:yes stop_codon:yes gene_type:complete
MKATEANILSFKIIVNHSGAILTEMGGVPEDRLHEVFKGDELILVRKIVREAKPKLEKMHEFLERELTAFTIA